MKKRMLLYGVITFELIILALVVYFYNPFLHLKLIGNEIVKISLGETYTDSGVKASFFNQDLTEQVEIDSNLDTNELGEYAIEYTLKSGNHEKKVVRKVIVADLVSPDIILEGSQDVILCGRKYVEEGYQAYDEVDGDLTNKVKVQKEENRIIYTVSDSSGNSREVIRNLIKTDNVKPTLTLNNSSILTFKQGGTYVEFGAKAHDNCDGDITSKIEIINNVDTNKHGNFEVIYRVQDETGNVSEIKRDIVIYNSSDLNKGYEEIVEGPTYINGILLVNKKYSISKSFEAYNDAAERALKEMTLAAEALGYKLPRKSGIRTYDDQKDLYERYTIKYGNNVDTRAARPGHSEHETGMAFDIGIISEAFAETDTYKWLKENCSNYGFIIRYPKYKEAITGYNFEPWHVRYVGVEAAKEIMAREITLEEYLGVFTLDNQ